MREECLDHGWCHHARDSDGVEHHLDSFCISFPRRGTVAGLYICSALDADHGVLTSSALDVPKRTSAFHGPDPADPGPILYPCMPRWRSDIHKRQNLYRASHPLYPALSRVHHGCSAITWPYGDQRRSRCWTRCYLSWYVALAYAQRT